MDNTPFDVLEYRVLGNTVLALRDVERAVINHLGPGRTIADVEAARTALESAYRSAGYGTVFVDIPEQDTAGGIVRLRVTEGRIDRVRVSGTRYFSNRRILAALPSVRSGDVPNLPAVQAELAELNGVTRDRSVVPVLKAGRTPGTVDMELKVDDELPLHASVEVNDRYSAGTSRLRTNLSLSYDNLFQKQQSLGLQYQIAPEEKRNLEAFVASYVFRVPAIERTTFAAYAVRSDTDVAALGTLSVLGKGEIVGLRAIRALPATATFGHSVTFGVDYKDFDENIRLSEDEGVQTPIRYVNWSLAYGGSRRTELATFGYNVTTNFGIRGAVNDTYQFADKRYLGRPNYLSLRSTLEYERSLGGALRLYGRIGGQYSADALITNEQLALGGRDTVRGYLESAVLGDYGAYGTLEVRSPWPFAAIGVPAAAAHVHAFVDAGIVALNDPLPGQSRSADVAGVGVGLRLPDFYGLDFALDWARALTAAGETSSGEDRTHFSVRYEF